MSGTGSPGNPDMLQSMGLQRVGHDWATELNWNTQYYLCELLCTSESISINSHGIKKKLSKFPQHCPKKVPQAPWAQNIESRVRQNQSTYLILIHKGMLKIPANLPYALLEYILTDIYLN